MICSDGLLRFIIYSTVLLFFNLTYVAGGVPECKTPEDLAHGFNCVETGKCITWSGRCDGRYDCGGVDFSDEENCQPEECRVRKVGYPGHWAGTYCAADKTCKMVWETCKGKCPPGRYKCNMFGGHESCYEEKDRCNGISNCDAGEDEMGCKPEDCRQGYRYCQSDSKCVSEYSQCSDGTCPADRLPCVSMINRNECVNQPLRCDGHRICLNGEDEANCAPEECKEGAWYCASDKTCINLGEKCAGACQAGYTSCGEDSGTCFKNEARCDGEQNCPQTGADERSCQPEECQDTAHYCHSKKSCLSWREDCDGVCGAPGSVCPRGPCRYNHLHSKEVRCDGKPDCDDGSDETNCTPDACARFKVTGYAVSDIRSHFKGRVDYEYDRETKTWNLSSLYRWCEKPGTCVKFYQKCQDGSCGPEERPCGAGDNTCYVSKLRCDGHRDCADGADERECQPEECGRGTRHCAGEMACKPMSVQCNDGKCSTGYTPCQPGICYSTDQKCDGYAHCPDASDEIGC